MTTITKAQVTTDPNPAWQVAWERQAAGMERLVARLVEVRNERDRRETKGEAP